MATDDYVLVRLHPFSHQVGGHSTMLKLNETTVCKPLISREYKFYKSLPKELEEFAPRYKGSIGVEFEKEKNGYISIIGYLPPSKLTRAGITVSSISHRTNHELNNADESTDSDDYATYPDRHDDAKDVYRIQVESATGQLVVHNDRIDLYDNPEDKMNGEVKFSKGIETLLADCSVKRHRFILLENLVGHYHRPCILDLKMGTRQHGDYDSDLKIEVKKKRCQLTTSASLGVRICGMQVYNVATGKYLNKDKYYGRTLNDSGLRETLQQFLQNGARVDVVKPMVDKLNKFYNVVVTQDTFRFYSTSLLLIYEGALARGLSPLPQQLGVNGCATEEMIDVEHATSDVRIIDFAHVTFRGFDCDKKVHAGPDEGYLFGLRNLINLLQGISSSSSSTEQ